MSHILSVIAGVRVAAAALALCFALAAATLPGCSEADAPPQVGAPDERAAALVALAQSYHVQADVAVERDDLAAAEGAMRELLETLHAQTEAHPEALALALDASTRLARILVDQGRPQDALAVTDAAIERAGERIGESIFGGYLYQTRGNIQRALGDDAGTVASHREAIMIFKALLDARQAR